jgi:hypothetical protein
VIGNWNLIVKESVLQLKQKNQENDDKKVKEVLSKWLEIKKMGIIQTSVGLTLWGMTMFWVTRGVQFVASSAFYFFYRTLIVSFLARKSISQTGSWTSGMI